jgi:outer membrane protein assembly factor BamB
VIEIMNSRWLLAVVLAASTFSVSANTPGTVLWEARPGFRDFGGITAAGGLAVTGNITGEGGIFAFDAASGKLRWKSPVGQMRGGPVTDGQHVFVVADAFSRKNALYALDLKTGKTVWQLAEEAIGGPTPLVADRVVYLPSRNGNVYALDAVTGKELWRFRFSPSFHSPEETSTCPTRAVLSEGVLFFGGADYSSQNGYLWALDASSGKVLWKAQMLRKGSRTSPCISTPAVSGHLVVTTAVIASNFIAAYNVSTGGLAWKQEDERIENGKRTASALSSVVIADGVAYSLYENGLAYWSVDSGRPLGRIAGNFTTSSYVSDDTLMAESGGTLYFLGHLPDDGDEYPGEHPLHAMDLATRKILWTHRVNRTGKVEANWRTRQFLVTNDAIYYENNKFMAKISR